MTFYIDPDLNSICCCAACFMFTILKFSFQELTLFRSGDPTKYACEGSNETNRNGAEAY